MKPVRTPEDHRRLIDEIAGLMGAEPGTPEADRLEVLAILASEYEKRSLPPESDPVDLLNMVMRGRGLSQAELSEVLGSRARASEVLSRRRSLSAEMIERLSRAWSIPRRLLAAPFPLARRRLSGTTLSIIAGGLALLGTATMTPFLVYGRDLPDVAPLLRDRAATDLSRLPPHVAQAFIAAEDRAFLSHAGIDGAAVARAIGKNSARGWEHTQGASTLTQQLLKNTLLAGEPRSLRRKVREFWLSREIEQRLDKDRILGLYLSHVYFGGGTYGIAAASQRYFGRQPAELTVGQAAYLAGLVDAPDARRFDRAANRPGALAAREIVLERMARSGFLTPAMAEAASRERLW